MATDHTVALHAAIDAGDMDEFDRLAAIINKEDDERQARLNAAGTFRKAAEWYIKVGVPVFPVIPKGKRPIASSAHKVGDPLRATCKGDCGQAGHGLYDATTDPEKIRSWWSRNPLANIATRTGLYFDVIDVDGPQGYKSLAEMREAGAVPPILGRALTPRGGMHLYVPASGEGNTTDLLDQVDYRGKSGFIVLPPSYVVETQKGYEGRYVFTDRPDFKKLVEGARA